MTDHPRRPRVLLIAEAANPEFVSVPLVGWSIAAALREKADVHIVTQIRNRDAILRAGLIEGRDFTALDSEKVAAPLWKLGQILRMGKGKGWTMLQAISAISYRYFEHLVWQKFGRAIRAGEYDIVHRVTPLSPTTPSWVAPKVKAAGCRFVVGPINGGVPWPRGFDSERRREREWLSYIRGAYKLLPGRTGTLAAAAAILVGSRHTESEIPASYRDRCVYLPENAIDPARFNLRAEVRQTGPLRVGFVGRLVPYKGADMLIEAALPFLRAGEMEISIIGDGPMMAPLTEQAAREGVTEAVTFHGWKQHHEVQEILAGCDLLGFPSIREFGGGVVLEAMALGVAPLVVDYAGPGELVGPGTGFKVPIGTRPEIVAALRDRLGHLVAHRAEIADAAAGGLDLVARKFTWERKAAQICEVYDWVLGLRPDRPDPFGPVRD